jgi:polyphosphate kinase
MPIKNQTVHRQLLDETAMVILYYKLVTWNLLQDRTCVRVFAQAEAFRAHAYLLTSANLSGRGEALRRSPLTLVVR